MNKVWKWILIFVGALIVVFLATLAFLVPFSRVGRLGYGGMMRGGYGMFGYGMMGFHPLGWLLGLVVLGFAIYGIVALFSRNSRRMPPPAPKTCPNCGRIVESDWVSCPHCGQDLRNQPPAQVPPPEEKPQ